MARPLVLVFQELAAPTATPTIPDLNTVIVGPAYELLDYPDDAASILLSSTYGLADQPASTYVPPAAGSDAVTVVGGGYPEQSAGSMVDHNSVRFILRFPRVVLASTLATVAPYIGTHVTTNVSDQTLITLVGAIGGQNFSTAGIRPGDRVVLTSASNQTVVRTVSTVGEPNSSGLATNTAVFRITQNLPPTGTGAGQWNYGGNSELRIERELPIQELEAPGFVVFPDPGSDTVVIRGGITVDVSLTAFPTIAAPSPVAATVSRTLSYSQLYLAYRALRQDLQQVESYDTASLQTVNGVPTVVGVGKIDARNPLAVGISLAIQNSGTAPIYAYGVSADDLVGHANARDAMSMRKDLYAFVPLTQDINIIAAYKTEFDDLADPTTALDNGVPQKFRIVIGSVPLPTATTLYEGSISGVSQQTGTASGLYRTVNISAASTGSLLPVNHVLPGDTVIIGLVDPADAAWQNRRGSHTVGHVNTSFSAGVTASNFEVIPGSSRWDSSAAPAGSSDIEIVIKGPDGSTKMSNLAQATKSTGSPAVAATGSITVVDGTTMVDGETFTLNDGVNPPTTFEFDSGGGVAPGNVAIAFALLDTPAQIAAATQAAINGVGGSLAITANAPAGAVVPLVNDVAGVAGNVSITTSPAPAFTASGLGGGAAATLSSIQYAMAAPTVVGGPYTVEYLVVGAAPAVTVSVVGFAITVTVNGTSHTANDVAAAINTHPVTSVLMTALVTAGGTNTVLVSAPTSIAPVVGSCVTTITVNDNLYNRLEDASALFLTAGIRAGDTIEMPLDPNDYGPAAFSGRVLAYTVATVLNENRLLIQCPTDDTGSVANELPHFYLRDVANRVLDNSTPNAISYRVRRQLTKDEQVLNLVTVSQSVRSKRCTITWPDQVQVADLRDGSLARATASIRALAGDVPGYYIGCQVGGACAGLPAQHGLTNLGFSGVSALRHSQGYFTERQLSRLSDGGFFVLVQNVPGALPICIHQLTTDPTTLETGELSVVRNVDFVSKFFLDLLEPFIGVYNVTQATQNAIFRAVTNGAQNLIGRSLDRIGPPLISGSVTSIKVSEFDASRIELYFRGVIPRPLNTIAFHLVV